jgi:hypothetical protein
VIFPCTFCWSCPHTEPNLILPRQWYSLQIHVIERIG